MNDEPSSSASVATDDAPTRQLVSAAAGDRCVSCGTPLSADQRYCVSCGERRGKPRFSVASAAPATSPDPPAAPPPRTPRASSGATVVAGVGTLLLAMGVGVLIGHNTAPTTKPVAAAPPTVVTVNGGAAAPTSTAAANATPNKAGKHGSKSTAKSKSSSKSTAKSSKASAAQAAKASNAASKVLGSSKTLPPATVTQGQTGSGPGYNKKTKKFDGSFFGQ